MENGSAADFIDGTSDLGVVGVAAVSGAGGDGDSYVHSGYLTLVDKFDGAVEGAAVAPAVAAGAKFYCHYESKGKLFCMIQYNQVRNKHV